MDIYTAQYRYSGADRLDITVKGQDPLGRIFAPTWDMVMGVKKGHITENDYAMAYIPILLKAIRNEDVVKQIKERYKNGITLVCYCPSGHFCHRILSARGLSAAGWGNYIEERKT
jgi:hypothetical protein